MFKFADLLPIAFPILATAVGWLIAQLISVDNRITKIEAAMPVLIAPDGTANDSPQSAKERAAMKEQITNEINDLKIRMSVLEQKKD